MAGTSIGSAALILKADGANLTAGLKQAESQVGGFFKKLTGYTGGSSPTGKGIAAGLLGGLSSVRGQLNSFNGSGSAGLNGISGLIGGALSGGATGAGIGMLAGGPPGAAIGAVVGAATGAVSSLVGEIPRMNEQFRETKRLAGSLGLPIGQFQALQYAAQATGVDAETLAKGMKHLVSELSDARGGSNEAVAKFAAIGVNLDSIKGKNADQSLGAVADAIAAIKDPTDQVRAAMLIFGERVGGQLTPMLARGSSGLNDLKKEAESLGLVLDAEGAAKLSAANSAFRIIGASWNGLIQKLAVEFAPVIYYTGKIIGQVVQMISGMFGSLVDGIKSLGFELEDWEQVKKKFRKEFTSPTADQGAIERDKKQTERALSLVSEGPLEAFKKNIEALGTALKQHAITADQSAFATTRVAKSLIDATGVGEYRPTGTALEGSKEAVSAIIRSQSPTQDPAAQLRAALIEGKEIAKRQLATSEVISRTLKQIAKEKDAEGGFNEL